MAPCRLRRRVHEDALHARGFERCTRQPEARGRCDFSATGRSATSPCITKPTVACSDKPDLPDVVFPTTRKSRPASANASTQPARRRLARRRATQSRSPSESGRDRSRSTVSSARSATFDRTNAVTCSRIAGNGGVGGSQDARACLAGSDIPGSAARVKATGSPHADTRSVGFAAVGWAVGNSIGLDVAQATATAANDRQRTLRIPAN